MFFYHTAPILMTKILQGTKLLVYLHYRITNKITSNVRKNRTDSIKCAYFFHARRSMELTFSVKNIDATPQCFGKKTHKFRTATYCIGIGSFHYVTKIQFVLFRYNILCFYELFQQAVQIADGTRS